MTAWPTSARKNNVSRRHPRRGREAASARRVAVTRLARMVLWPGSGFCRCVTSGVDGTLYDKVTYAALYAALGGAASPWGQNATHFNVPNMIDRVAMGCGDVRTRHVWRHAEPHAHRACASTRGWHPRRRESHARPGQLRRRLAHARRGPRSSRRVHTHGVGSVTIGAHTHGVGTLRTDDPRPRLQPLDERRRRSLAHWRRHDLRRGTHSHNVNLATGARGTDAGFEF
jgi:hypothetical protein